MNERIEELRKELGLTMEKFGDRLGVTRSAVSNLEKGNRNVTDQMFKSVCREFNVNPDWLRTGEGEMFQKFDEDERFAMNVGKLQRTDDETLIRWVNAIAETDPYILKEIESFMRKILDIEE